MTSTSKLRLQAVYATQILCLHFKSGNKLGNKLEKAKVNPGESEKCRPISIALISSDLFPFYSTQKGYSLAAQRLKSFLLSATPYNLAPELRAALENPQIFIDISISDEESS